MIKADSLVKKFDSLVAVDSVSFEVKIGEVFGLLGPNGAGKTTTIRMFTGILKPTSGSISIGGYDIQKNPLAAKQLMGIAPEMANAYIDLSAFKNLVLMGELYGMEKEKRERRAEELLRQFKLFEKRKQKVKKFSKGMKQRLIVAMALISSPKLLFLDEPTSGLDVASVRLIRDIIVDFNKQGTTILLTTHNIEEASQLCDRVAIMNHGRIVAIDRPENLKQVIQSTSSIEVAFDKPVEPEAIALPGVISVKKVGDRLKFYTNNPGDIIQEITNYSKSSNNKIMALNTLEPSLEDVFLKLTKKESK